jgi:hypothetical protein
MSIILIHLGAGRHIGYIQTKMDKEQRDQTEVLDFAAHLIYTTAMFTSRFSGLAFYHRLCELHDKLAIAIKCAVALLVVIYLPQMLLIIFHCRPVTAIWPHSWQDNVNYVCISWAEVYLSNAGLSILCDIFMFAIPLALIHMLRLPCRGKLPVVLVLLPAVV